MEKIPLNAISHISGIRNVIGFSNYLMPNKDVESIRVYVTRKVTENQLRIVDLLPSSIDDIDVDVIEIGEIYAVPPVLDVGRREVVRPLVSGISVGNEAITAGTQGVPAEYLDGNIYGMSNAHVYTPDPSLETFSQTREYQPGPYDGGSPDNKIGEYFWHDRIIPDDLVSLCPLATGYAGFGNAVARLVRARTRFKIYVEGENNQDLAACKLDDGIVFDITKTYDFDISDYDLCSRIFAGSDRTSILCKMDYQLQSGFEPVVPYVTSQDLGMGAEVRKSGRTTFDTTGTITDMSSTLTVNYGNYYATLKDVIMTTNMCSGGDSGSDVWIKYD